MRNSIFVVETTALAHVACAPQESGILPDGFCCRIFFVATTFGSSMPSVRRGNQKPPVDSCAWSTSTALHKSNLQESPGGQFCMARASVMFVRRVASNLQRRSTISFDGSTTRSSQETPAAPHFFQPLSVCIRSRFFSGCFVLAIVDDSPVSSLSCCGSGDWTQP